MNRYITSLCLALLTIVLHSCGVTGQRQTTSYYYTVTLEEVKVDGVEAQQEQMSNLSYTDSLMSISFEFRDQQVGLTVRNSSPRPLTLEWDKCAYVDAVGTTSRVIHEGVKFIDKQLPQTNSVILSNAFLTDIMVPANYIERSNNIYVGWTIYKLLPTAYRHNTDMGLHRKNRILISFEQGGKQMYYEFTFNVAATPR